jgi:hypothetical protein
MTYPSLLLGLLISSFYGAGFHVWRGGGFGRLLLYLVLGWIGFWAGHFLAVYLGWSFGEVGLLQLGPASVISFGVLTLGHWLSKIEVERY